MFFLMDYFSYVDFFTNMRSRQNRETVLECAKIIIFGCIWFLEGLNLYDAVAFVD